MVILVDKKSIYWVGTVREVTQEVKSLAQDCSLVLDVIRQWLH